MKTNRFFVLVWIAGITACGGQPQVAATPQEAIETARTVLGYSDSTLSEIGQTRMLNSPSNELQVMQYQDEEGRSYYVVPGSNLLVEVDGRALIGSIWMSQPGEPLSAEALAQRAEDIAGALVPGFEKLKDKLTYEAGEKGEFVFYNWRAPIEKGQFMPPFIQVAMSADGTVFAFYNTVTIDD